ncbi:helix-turn-helix transcriptional regulator [Lentzea aerocolonigenes]|uniref:helix-turn-helix transcriptional regulator n=1 Tax=Lentzea aerocolonigenes TaxID=68170 RepID=UPI00075136A0|nr:LuxR family transcriptional regulator [Lentzea aerocolonigenes]
MAPVARPRVASPVMIGREPELAALVELVHALRPDVAATALVSGRAGMGKTRLIAEASRRWREEGARTLIGRCVPVEGTPYAPLVTSLRAALPSNAPLLRMLASQHAVSRQELFDALGSALAGLSARAPLILVVEDLHWSDRATRDALTYVLTQPFGGRLGMVGTYRSERSASPADLSGFADALSRDGPITWLTLEPLTPAQVGDLAVAITRARPTYLESASLHRRTGGIPLLVEEVLALGGTGLPDHLRAIFVTRVAEQGGAVAAALQVVAVAGHCDEMLVADALDVDLPGVADVLGRARDADLVVVDREGYRFRHDLLREAAYDEIPPGRRRELHRRVAELLSSRGTVDPAVLAGHWHLAGDRERVAVTSMAAAEQAELVHAPVAAHHHYERVVDAWPELGAPARRTCGPRDELLRRAAYAADRAGMFARAVELTELRVVAGGGTPADHALRWERLGRYRWEAGDGHGSRAAYEQAVRVLPADAPAAVRATVLSGLAWHLAQSFRSEEAKPLVAEALAACETVDDPGVRWQVHLAQGIAWLGTGTGHAALAESCRLATAVGAGERVVFSRLWLNISEQRRGRDAEREPNLRTALRAAAAEGLASGMEAAPRYMLAEFLGETGRWDEAVEELELNVGRLHVTGVPALFSWGYLARLTALRGDLVAAEQALERTRVLTARAPQQPVPLAAALVGRAERLLWEARVDEAVAVAREAVQLGSVDAYEAAEPLAVLCRAEADRAEQRVRHGSVPDAGVHGGLSTRLNSVRPHPAPRVRAFVATCEAELRRLCGERSAAPWEAAVQAWQVAGDPYREACARWRLAWALTADRSGRAEAAAQLGRAHDTATRLGALPLARAAERFATRARLPLGPSRPVREEPSLVAGLTAREMEVLPLLAAGHSNAEIAQILVMSPRTAGVHVSRILHKLGATRRAQVAGLARRTGLLEA